MHVHQSGETMAYMNVRTGCPPSRLETVAIYKSIQVGRPQTSTPCRSSRFRFPYPQSSGTRAILGAGVLRGIRGVRGL